MRSSIGLLYSLSGGSPCIDTGNPNSPLDPDGTVADMGVYHFDQNDTIPPTVTITSLSSDNVGTEDVVTVFWSASDNWILDSAFVDMVYADSTIRIDTLLANVGQATIAVPDSTLESFQLAVTVWDYRHNATTDTSQVITVYDNTSPVIDITHPSSNHYVLAHHFITSLTALQIWYFSCGVFLERTKIKSGPIPTY